MCDERVGGFSEVPTLRLIRFFALHVAIAGAKRFGAQSFVFKTIERSRQATLKDISSH